MKSYRKTIRFGLMLSAASLAAAASYAAAPAAGDKIGNQASATYVNAAGDTISVTSNKVETIVQQVAGMTLVTNNTENVAPGGKVFLPHTVTNDGNGTDIFELAAVDANTGDLTFTGPIKIFPDANFDGIADSTTEITVTPALAAGESFGFIIEATAPSTGTTETITVTAGSQFSKPNPTAAPALTRDNTDTVNISSGPITEIVKSMTVTNNINGPEIGPGDTVTVTLTYSSTGLTAATNLTVTDQLNEFLTYDAGSATWSDSSLGLDDASSGTDRTNGQTHTIDYSFTTDTATFTVNTVPSGRTGSVTFTATIDDDAPAGDIPNVATQTVEIGGVDVLAPPSNQAKVTVAPNYAVTAADAPSSRYEADPDAGGPTGNLLVAGASATDDDAPNDIVLETGDVSQGGTITMDFVLTNHSNTEDTIDVSFADVDFPTGTTFQLISNGAPVVGPLGPFDTGESTTVTVVATLPANAVPTAAGSTNYTGTLTAQSTNGGPSNFATGEFTGAVLGAAVDLQNSNGTGDGADNGVTQITTPTDPGDPVTFPVVIENLGPTSDTYNLSLATPLPAGWTVEFQLPDGTPVTNTGVIPGVVPGVGGNPDVVSSQAINVIVTPPAGATPGTFDVDLAVVSPTSGQGDTLTNAVTVNTIVDVAIASDQSVQVAPGGIADIPHTLTNEGNIAITAGAITLGALNSPDGFSTFGGTIFQDVNNDGVVDAGDKVITDISQLVDAGGATLTLGLGETVSLIHRVQVPSNGAIGISETAKITVSTSLNGGAATDGDTTDNAVSDTVKIVSGDMTLVKLQAVDAACNGSTTAFVQTNVTAAPGQCIRYEITATNTGTENAGTVTIRDAVPSFTTLETSCGAGCAVAVSAGGSITVQPADEATGALESTHGTLIPGTPATLSFTVQIDE